MESTPRTYRRIGTVTARRLEADRTWLTTNGDQMQGHAGDWLVESPDGGQRTVTDGEFRTLYSPMGQDLWERTGTVTARQVSQTEVVSSLEGEGTANPGDWVVTSPDGNSWPVRDEVFRATYAPLGGGTSS